VNGSLTVVTPWLNHRELERDYWAAIRAADVEVIVIDNASAPPLPNAWRLKTNQGFSKASNIGLRLATTEAVVFLNNDVAAAGSGWERPLQAALEPGVLVGANLRYDPHGAVDGQSLPYLDGWCLAGMRDDLLELGGFDETFEEPSYYSDNDLCLRARAAGMTLREARVPLIHKANQTAGSAATPAVRRAAEINRVKFQERARDRMAVAA
jgi:GT2 family glycosyltransferase